MDFDVTPFKRLILQKSGISIDESRTEELVENIRNMMLKKGTKSVSEYYNLIIHNQLEFLDLLNLITVNETYFFREPGQIHLFSEQLVKERLIHLKPGEKIRILSAGCSTGEEPYSLAIAISQKFGRETHHLFSFSGADIDGDAIKTAEQGIYSCHSFRSMDRHYLNEYFMDTGSNKYQINSSIKQLVTFYRLNLLNFPYPEALSNMDVVFYRNVSIYFPKEIQHQIFRNLSKILKENGYLIVSATETLSHGYDILKLIETDGHFIFKKEVSKGNEQLIPDAFKKEDVSESFQHIGLGTQNKSFNEIKPFDFSKIIKQESQSLFSGKPVSSSAGSANDQSSRNPAETLYEEALTLARGKKYENSIQLLDNISNSNPNHIKGLMLKAGILVNLKRPDEAERICRSAIEKDPLCMESYILSGIIAKEQRRLKDAEKFFKSAIYIHTSSWLVHFHLAEIHQSMCENKRAVREYETTVKCLTTDGYHAHGLTLFTASFSADDIMNLCRLRISQINKIGGPNGVR